MQDSIWKVVATGMGFDATIVPQSALDDVANFTGTDLLIVSSGTISYAGTDHVHTIEQFVQSGRPTYIQAEYLLSYQGNQRSIP